MNHSLRYSHKVNHLPKSLNRLAGVEKAATLLQSAFDKFEDSLQEGLNPEDFKANFVDYLKTCGAKISIQDVAFCRFGELHATASDVRPLQWGEAFSIDAWLQLDGWYADMARPYIIGATSSQLANLYHASLACTQKAIEVAEVGTAFIAIAEAVQEVATKYNCYIVAEAFGHGIGQALHEEPEVPFSYKGRNLFSTIRDGDVITLEPVVALSTSKLIENDQGKVHLANRGMLLFKESIVAFEAGQKIILAH